MCVYRGAGEDRQDLKESNEGEVDFSLGEGQPITKGVGPNEGIRAQRL